MGFYLFPPPTPKTDWIFFFFHFAPFLESVLATLLCSPNYDGGSKSFWVAKWAAVATRGSNISIGEYVTLLLPIGAGKYIFSHS